MPNTSVAALQVLRSLWADGNAARCRVQLPDTVLFSTVRSVQARGCEGQYATAPVSQRRMPRDATESTGGLPPTSLGL